MMLERREPRKRRRMEAALRLLDEALAAVGDRLHPWYEAWLIPMGVARVQGVLHNFGLNRR